MKKIYTLPAWNRKYLLGMIPVLLVLAVTVGLGGYWFRTVSRRQSLASRVPAAAIGYIEVSSLTGLLGQVSATRAWREVAALAGLADEDAWAFSAVSGRWAGLPIPGNELAVLADSPLALVVTAIEVNGQEVRPRLALLVETGPRLALVADGSDGRIGARLRQLAARLYGEGQFEERHDWYAGIKVVSYQPVRSETGEPAPARGLFAARMESGWIIANHLDPLRQSLDAWLGRVPTMSGSFHWQQARRRLTGLGPGSETAAVDGLFGFIPGEGVVRLLRSATHLVAAGSTAPGLFAEVLGDVAVDFSTKAGEGLAFREQYGPAGATSRYVALLRPDLTDALRAAIRPLPPRPADRTGQEILDNLSDELSELTIYRVESPARAMGAIEAAISARIGAGQSFLLHQFLMAAREGHPAIDDESMAEAAFGDVIIAAGFAGESGDRLWLLEIRDQAAMARLIASHLARRRGEAADWDRSGILDSGDLRRGAATVLGNHLLLASSARLRSLLDHRSAGAAGKGRGHLSLDLAEPADDAACVISHFRTTGESVAGIFPLMRLLARRPTLEPSPEEFGRRMAHLPASVRTVRIAPEGIEIESTSPLGSIPGLASILESAGFGGMATPPAG